MLPQWSGLFLRKRRLMSDHPGHTKPARRFHALNRSLSYGYSPGPFNRPTAPFNPASCRTTNNFNALMPFGTFAAGNSLYFWVSLRKG